MTLLCAGNMLGALMLVGIAAFAGVFHDAPSGAMYYATYKTSHSFLEVTALVKLPQLYALMAGKNISSCYEINSCNVGHEAA